MNEFGTPRLEAFVPKEQRKTGRQEVQAAVEAMRLSAEVRPEDITRQLREIRTALSELKNLSSGEIHALEVSRAALLEYRNQVDSQPVRNIRSVDDAQDMPTLSEDAEKSHPDFAAAEAMKVYRLGRLAPPKHIDQGGTAVTKTWQHGQDTDQPGELAAK